MRLFSALLRWGLGLCAAVLVLAALYVSLGRELVPMVAEYRLELEDRASAQLGVPVRIGSLEGRWQGFAPLLVARDVRLGEEGEGHQPVSRSAIWTALRAAPLRRLSATIHRLIAPGTARSSRTRPTNTSSVPTHSTGCGCRPGA